MVSPDAPEADGHAATMASIDGALSPSARGILREVAHMLRSPLGAIVMLTETLRERGHEMTEEHRDDHLSIVYRAALAVSELAGDLLILAGDGTPQPSLREFSPRQLLSVIADVTQPVATVRGCAVSLSAPEEAVIGPELTITRAMLGLTLRAMLRTRGGGLRLRAAKEGPGRMTFGIVRQGAGVVPENGVGELTRVVRLEPETGEYTLSAEGLGLAATEKLLCSMGSTLQVATSDGSLSLAFAVSTERGGGPS